MSWICHHSITFVTEKYSKVSNNNEKTNEQAGCSQIPAIKSETCYIASIIHATEQHNVSSVAQNDCNLQNRVNKTL